MKPKDQDCSVGGDDANVPAHGSYQTQHTQPSQPQKKLVRRRLRTSKPYQERLLNMAEARREIVTALKLHRAAMRRASEQYQQEQDHQQSRPLQPPVHSNFGIEDRTKSMGNPRIYPSSSVNFFNYMESIPYPSTFSRPPPRLNASYWSPSLMTHIPSNENLNFTLPSQTLGLNLNFQHFNNLDATLLHNITLSLHQSTLLSSSSSPSLSLATDQGRHSESCEGAESSLPADGDKLYGRLRLSVDNKEMAETKSLGEQHQMEWDDTVDLASSAGWLRFLKSMEIDKPERTYEEEDWFHPFDEVMEFPAWLNANESCLQQYLGDHSLEDFFQDHALPCMDIGEIEGMDGEWLA